MPLTPETHTFKTVADCELKIDVYRPDAVPVPTPLIVHLHGGALIYGCRKDAFQWQVEYYTNHGYTFASIDYRLAPESKLPDIIEDLQDAFRWVRREGPRLLAIDPRRIAAVGCSAGGYLALMSGCCVDPLPQAIVSLYGYGDLIGDWYSKPAPFYCENYPSISEEDSGWPGTGPVTTGYDKNRGLDQFYHYCRQKGLWPEAVGGRDPHEDPTFFSPYCPIQNVTSTYPPTCLLHGTDDRDVPYGQSVLMAEELARHNVEHRLITMDGQGHCFDGDHDGPMVKEVFRDVLTFFDKYVKNQTA